MFGCSIRGRISKTPNRPLIISQGRHRQSLTAATDVLTCLIHLADRAGQRSLTIGTINLGIPVSIRTGEPYGRLLSPSHFSVRNSGLRSTTSSSTGSPLSRSGLSRSTQPGLSRKVSCSAGRGEVPGLALWR